MSFKIHLIQEQILSILESYDKEDDSHDRSEAEEWLAKYVHEGLDKWPDDDVLSFLLKKYPYEGGVLYRGLNFHNKEQYETFMGETNQGTKLATGGITSWSERSGTAYPFAITRPTYFLNRELMQAEDLKNKNLDYMIGEVGVILKLEAKKGSGIDVRLSGLARESEVIIAPGEYTISIYKKHLPFMKSITTDNFKSEFMKINELGDDHSMDMKKFKFILFHYKDLDAELTSHLNKILTKIIDNVKYDVSVHDMFKFGERYDRISVDWNLPIWFFVYVNLLHSDDVRSIYKKLDPVIRNINRDFLKKTKNVFSAAKINDIDIHVSSSMEIAMKSPDLNKKFIFNKKINRLVGDRYNELNSRDTIDKINDLSGSEQRKAISDIAAELKRILSNVR